MKQQLEINRHLGMALLGLNCFYFLPIGQVGAGEVFRMRNRSGWDPS
jgi:hypothetical protein